MAALKSALAAGIGEERFWSLTPYQCELVASAAIERERLVSRRALWAAWQIARYQRTKVLSGAQLRKDLNDFDGRSPKRLEGDELLAAVERLNASFGGVDVRKKR